ncbi:hypothetical protein SAMN05192561_11230 [Halopenitus malekzadehii]|uniref:Uncharacterized protein n=1 Tax=Halopenitus malekzadehii TaxID=1267564 RepID=A0A1H6JEN8_9EURY|nr:hypothetical protein [Halopenitus malekzadehii]SEH60703.1 hypothetical protein SAMN05192561_11230 [Halopenitus malekzadehii]
MSGVRELHEMKAEIAQHVGTDPDRYGEGCGHKQLLASEVRLVSEKLGMNLSDQPRQHVRDALMIRTGRDDRTGVSFYDSRDVEAILNELEAIVDG